MARELQNEIFQELRGASESTSLDTNIKKTSVTHTAQKSPDLASGAQPNFVSQITESVNAIKKKTNELQGMMDVANQRIVELAKTHQNRWERMQSSVQMLDSGLKDTIRILGERFSQVMGKISERRISEAKIQELIDRHNQIVMTFETRISSTQRQAAEMEVKVLGSQAQIEELRRELERVKQEQMI